MYEYFYAMHRIEVTEIEVLYQTVRYCIYNDIFWILYTYNIDDKQHSFDEDDWALHCSKANFDGITYWDRMSPSWFCDLCEKSDGLSLIFASSAKRLDVSQAPEYMSCLLNIAIASTLSATNGVCMGGC